MCVCVCIYIEVKGREVHAGQRFIDVLAGDFESNIAWIIAFFFSFFKNYLTDKKYIQTIQINYVMCVI